jgi:hypothetical protein
MLPLPMIAPVTHDNIISYDDFVKCNVSDLEYVEIFALLKAKFQDLLNENIISFKIDAMQNVKVFYLHDYREILVKSFNLNRMDYLEIHDYSNHENHHLNLFDEIISHRIIQVPYPAQWKNEMYRYDIFDAFEDKHQFHVDVSDIDSIEYFVETLEANIPYFVFSELNLFKNTRFTTNLIEFSQKIHGDFIELKENSCSVTTLDTLQGETEKFAQYIAKIAERKLVKKILSEIFFEKNQDSKLKNILSGSDLFDSNISSNQYVKEYIFNKVKTHFENIDSVERDAIFYANLGSDWLDELDGECHIELISDVVDEVHTLNKISRNVLKCLGSVDIS